MKRTFRRLALATAIASLAGAMPSANHAWGNYHWGRMVNPVALQVGDNVTSNWDAYLDEAIHDWNASQYVQLTEVAGGSNPKNCRPTAGRIEVCNAKYGNNGWLGIAQIWISGSHITQAITKLNDTYFNTATYNTPPWRRLVTCQEIAHDFGLGHQDETFNNVNLGSCMDYTNDPDGGAGGAVNNDPGNEHPNQHDFEQLKAIYTHLDNQDTASSTLPNFAGAEGPEHPGQWGRLIHSSQDRRVQVFELEIGRGQRIITHVFWADPENDARAQREH